MKLAVGDRVVILRAYAEEAKELSIYAEAKEMNGALGMVVFDHNDGTYDVQMDEEFALLLSAPYNNGKFAECIDAQWLAKVVDK